MNSVQQLYSQEQTADRLGISIRTLQWWIRDGRFPPPIRIGRTPYWEPSTIQEFFASKLDAQSSKGNINEQTGVR